MNGYKEFLAVHLPPRAFDPSAAGFGNLLAALAPALDAAAAESAELTGEAFPDSTNELLAAWEVSYGIEPDASTPTASRTQRLLAAVHARGGLSRAYFIELASALGYSITIDEFVPFMAGWGRAGDTIYAPEVVNVWNVKTSGSSAWRTFQAGIGRAGEPLGANVGSLLETVFKTLKPAHTFVFFTYS